MPVEKVGKLQALAVRNWASVVSPMPAATMATPAQTPAASAPMIAAPVSRRTMHAPWMDPAGIVSQDS